MYASRLAVLGYTIAGRFPLSWMMDEVDGPKAFLPFGTAECLDKLVCVGALLAQSFSELSASIRELRMEWTPGCSTSQFIQLLKPLTSLSMLILSGYEAREEAILSPFTCLTRYASIFQNESERQNEQPFSLGLCKLAVQQWAHSREINLQPF